MRCFLDNDTICRRCRRAGVPCVFVPRANAAGVSSLQPSKDGLAGHRDASILRRLHTIETLLGISEPESLADAEVGDGVDEIRANVDRGTAAQDPFWRAVAVLRSAAPNRVNPSIWEEGLIRDLWSQSVATNFSGFLFTDKP